MAIVVQCFQCNNVLELDDGFRGGVARCSNCGALLKVPKEAAGAPAAYSGPRSPAMPQPRPRSSSDPGISSGALKTAGSNRRASEPTTSSGAFSRSPRPRAPAVPQPMVRPGQNRSGTGTTSDDVGQPQGLRANRSLYLLFIFLIGVIFCVAAAVIVHELSPKRTVTIVPYSPANSGNNNEANANNNAPKFLGIPMTGAHVVFAIDGSAANADTYNLIVQNAQYAVKHGLSSTHYRVLIWDNGGGVTVPSHGWIRKSTAATQWTPAVNYAPTGNSDPLETILHSSKLGGDQIILVTARTDIPSQLATQVNDLQIPSRIDAISVNTPSTILAQIADQHRGIYEQVSTVDLQNALTGQN